MRRWIIIIVVVFSSAVFGAQWTGHWGNGQLDASTYPSPQGESPGRWDFGNELICWEFDNTGEKNWNEWEKNVAIAAFGRWNGNGSKMLIQGCSRSPDILLRWQSPKNNNLVGEYIPIRTSKTFRDRDYGGEEPCLVENINPCSIILLEPNKDIWFVDRTPSNSEEFDRKGERTFCEGTGKERTIMFFTATAGEATERLDLFTVLQHEIGHSLGEIHTLGCDGDPFTAGSEDDDGYLMWGGGFDDRRENGNSFRFGVGFGERRFVDAAAIDVLNVIYNGRLSKRFPSLNQPLGGSTTITGRYVYSPDLSLTAIVAGHDQRSVAKLEPDGTFEIPMDQPLTEGVRVSVILHQTIDGFTFVKWCCSTATVKGRE